MLTLKRFRLGNDALVQRVSNALDPLSARAFRGRRVAAVDDISADRGNVVLLPFRVTSGASWFELILARALRQRGYRPLIGVGERAVSLADGYLVSGERFRDRHLNLWRTERFVRSFGEAPLHFDRLLGSATLTALRSEAAAAPIEQIPTYSKYGVDVGRQVMSSLCRYFLQSRVDVEAEPEIARGFLFTALVSLEAARRIHETFAPKLLISSHGIYASWGVFCDYFKMVGTPFVTWGFQYKSNAFLFSHNQSYHQDVISETGAVWQGQGLDPVRRAELLEYITRKGSASHSDNINYYASTKPLGAPLRQTLGIASEARVFGMFPNLGWDAQISFKPKFFATMNDWLVETVAWFAERPELSLIIRAHPAEIRVGFETREKTADILNAAFETLPPNVHLIAPGSSTSSYDVLEEVDGCLVFGSKFGLEAAVQGKPVLTAGEAYFSGKGVSFDPVSKAEYFDLLGQMAQGLQPRPGMVEAALGFGYHYHVRRQIILPLAEMRGPRFIDYLFDDETALAPGGIPELDHLIEACLTGKPFHALGS